MWTCSGMGTLGTDRTHDDRQMLAEVVNVTKADDTQALAQVGSVAAQTDHLGLDPPATPRSRIETGRLVRVPRNSTTSARCAI